MKTTLFLMCENCTRIQKRQINLKLSFSEIKPKVFICRHIGIFQN